MAAINNQNPAFIARKSAEDIGLKADLRARIELEAIPCVHLSRGYMRYVPLFSGALPLRDDR